MFGAETNKHPTLSTAKKSRGEVHRLSVQRAESRRLSKAASRSASKMSFSSRAYKELTELLNQAVPLKVQKETIKTMESVSDPITTVIREILK